MIASIVLLLALAWYFLQKKGIPTEEIYKALHHFGFKSIFLAGVFIALQILFMALRIWILFPKEHRISLASAIHAVFYGQAVNTFVPARAGDVLKAVIFSKSSSQPVTTTAGIIVSDKVVDVLALALLIVSSGAFSEVKNLSTFSFSSTALTAIALTLILVVLLIFLFFRSPLKKLSTWGGSFKDGVLSILNFKRTLIALMVGIALWSFEALTIQVLCHAQIFPISFSQSVFLLSLLNLAIAVPLSVGNLGPFEAALVFGMQKLGAPTATAIALATACHLLQMGVLLLLTGFVALLRLRIRY